MKDFNTDYHSARRDYTDLIYGSDNMMPHRYVLVLTNLCNLRCSFCFQERKKLKSSLDLDGWKAVIDQLPDYAHVTLTGGEPFVFKQFSEIFKYITERHTCNIISNGTLLTEDLVELLLSRDKFKVLSISVDNIGNTLRDVRESIWKNTEQIMQFFKKRAFELKSKAIMDAKTVVLDENTKDLFKIYLYCKNTLKVDTHSFMLLKGHTIQHADFMHPISNIFRSSKAYSYSYPEMILKNFEKVRLYNVKNKQFSFVHPGYFDLNSDKVLNLKNAKFLTQKEHTPFDFLPCKAAWSSVHINTNGIVFPCMAVDMGNVKTEPLSNIIFGEKFSDFKHQISKHGTIEGCNRCGYLIPSK